MLLGILECSIENKKNGLGKTVFKKSGLRNLQEELVLSTESAKDCKRFHDFNFKFFKFFALFSKSSFVDI